MVIKVIQSPITRESRNDLNGNFDFLSRNVNQAINSSNNAENKSEQAINTASEAINISNTLKNVLNDLIIESGTSDAEVIASRSDSSSGQTFQTLQQRLDTQNSTVNSTLQNLNTNKADLTLVNQLQELVNRIDYREVSLSYGEMRLPNDFLPKLPFKIYRDFDGLVKHTLDFDSLVTGQTFYIDQYNGNDSGNEATSESPFKTFNYTINKINELNVLEATIIFKDRIVYRGSQIFSFNLNNKKIKITSAHENGSFITQGEPNLSWTLENGIYRTVRSNSTGVYDMLNTDAYGVPIPLNYVTSQSECAATPNSFYFSGTSGGNVLYVNRLDNLAPTDENTLVMVSDGDRKVTLNNSLLFFDNLKIFGGRSSSSPVPGVIEIYGDETGNTLTGAFYDRNCWYIGGDFRHIQSSIRGNAFETIELKECYNFNSIASYANRDGFNHHYVNILANPELNERECIAFQYNCVGYLNGTRSVDKNNNAFTSHEGNSVLRIGCIGYETTGPVLADVGGCDVILIDCHMRDTLLPTERYNYQFQDYSTGNGRTLMINCQSGGQARYDLITDLPVRLKGFRGRRLRGEEFITYID